MFCTVCGENTFIAHHVSYDPEISIPICDKCHRRIHYGDLSPLCPLLSKKRDLDPKSQSEYFSLPDHLTKFANMALDSKYSRRSEWLKSIENKDEKTNLDNFERHFKLGKYK